MKKCCRCQQEKPLDSFTRSKRTKTGFTTCCKECDASRVRDYYTINPHKQRDANLKKHYGITSKEYDTMLAKQGFRCAICGTDKAGGKHDVFHVDHCHATGEVRGLLCNGCNRGLGFFDDRPDVLKRAARYLESFG